MTLDEAVPSRSGTRGVEVAPHSRRMEPQTPEGSMVIPIFCRRSGTDVVEAVVAAKTSDPAVIGLLVSPFGSAIYFEWEDGQAQWPVVGFCLL